jgi:tRNA(fMet)-specific endonuclease VapC
MWHLLRKKATSQMRIFEKLYADSFARIEMTESCYHKAAQIKATLVESGTPIGNNDADIFIAAYCIVNGFTLVTDNVSDFSRIDELKVVNWKNR